MELILINDTKLKIILNNSDMEHYRLDCNCANYNNTETRRAFWDILDEAKHKTGFDAASDKVFIQLYPSKEGGCEMYVTKIASLCTSKCHTLQTKQSKYDPMIFSFKTLHDMILACRLIGSYAYHLDSKTWIDEMGTCYLLLTPEDGLDISHLNNMINEFGYSLSFESTMPYINEHGKVICETCAIEKLSVF